MKMWKIFCPLFALVLAICATFPVLASDFNPANDCEGVTKQVDSLESIQGEIDSIGPSNQETDGYVICFETSDGDPIPITNDVEIIGLNQPLTLYGLDLDVDNVMNLNTGVIGPYTGLILNITGSNITLHDLTIQNATDAVAIDGATNVSIVDSKISAKRNAISVTDSSGVSISGTHITGGENANSKAVSVTNSTNVSVTDNPEGISGFEYGTYIHTGSVISVMGTSFQIEDPLNAIFWNGGGKPTVDITKVGKRLNEAGDKVNYC